jgi:hypothetical protein
LQSENTPTLPERTAPVEAPSANPTDAAMALVNRPGLRRRTRILIGTVALALGMAGLATFAFWQRERPASELAHAAPTIAAAPLQPSAPSPPERSIRISASPPQATLSLDGQPLAQNPFVSVRPNDTTLHELRAEATDHEPELRWIRFDTNVDLTLVLRPHASADPNPPPAKRPPKKTTRRTPATPSAETPPATTAPATTPPIQTEPPAPAHGRSSKKGLQLDRSDPWKNQ